MKEKLSSCQAALSVEKASGRPWSSLARYSPTRAARSFPSAVLYLASWAGKARLVACTASRSSLGAGMLPQWAAWPRGVPGLRDRSDAQGGVLQITAALSRRGLDTHRRATLRAWQQACCRMLRSNRLFASSWRDPLACGRRCPDPHCGMMLMPGPEGQPLMAV